MRPEEKRKAIEAIKKFKTKEKLLISTHEEGYLGKKSYKVTLENGATMPCEQITKRKDNGDAVVIIPITTEGNYLVVVQARPNTYETVAIEFPAGMVDKNENNEYAAIRELVEETGYVPTSVYKLESHYQDQGCSKALITTYVAEGCQKKQEQQLDEEENLTCIEVSDQDIRDLLNQKKENLLTEIGMRDANSKIGYMTLQLKRKNLL